MTTYIVIAIIALALVAVWLAVTGQAWQDRRLSPIAAVAFSLVLAGIVFGESRLLGYSLMGLGVALAIIDFLIRRDRI